MSRGYHCSIQNQTAFGPLLMKTDNSQPVLVALYDGKGKPNDVDGFMYNFTDEYQGLSSGLLYGGSDYNLFLRSVDCDTPARSFMKRIIGHNGLHGCERCCAKAFFRGRVCFNDFTAQLRTDDRFANHAYQTHQLGISPLATVFNCVTGFPLDYMQLVCLGSLRRLIKFWKSDKTSKFSPAVINIDSF